MMPDVSIIIPTFKRPKMLKDALNSVFAQKSVGVTVEIVVMDNDPKASARETVMGLHAKNGWTLVYGHEPARGVASVRNTALKLAKAKLVMFLDDDQTVAPGWLQLLLQVQAQTGADLVFGPVHGKIAGDVPHKTYIQDRFSRFGPTQSGLINKYYGCSNSLIKRDRFFKDMPVFDPQTNETGGEDDVLFSTVQRQGARIAWAAEAFVYEDIPPARATLAYAMTKAFAFGQGPTQTAWQHRDLPQVAYWMGVGLGQTLVYGLATLLYWPLNRKKHVRMLDKTIGGLGKILWTDRFQPRFYGTASAL